MVKFVAFASLNFYFLFSQVTSTWALFLVCRYFYYPHRLPVAKFPGAKRHLMREGLLTPFSRGNLARDRSRAVEAQFNTGDMILNLRFRPVRLRVTVMLMADRP